MGSPIEFGNLKDANPPLSAEEQAVVDKIRSGAIKLPLTPGAPLAASDVFSVDPGSTIAPTLPQAPPTAPVNPYAPTGWAVKELVVTEATLPSGQRCRIKRFERSDMFKSGTIDHMDQLLPLLIDTEGIASEQERDAKIADAVKKNAHLIADIYTLVDVVVMSCSIIPAVTNNPAAVMPGTEQDWADPHFVPIVHLDSVSEDDRAYIFAVACGKDIDHLKSLQKQASSVESVSAIENVAQGS